MFELISLQGAILAEGFVCLNAEIEFIIDEDIRFSFQSTSWSMALPSKERSITLEKDMSKLDKLKLTEQTRSKMLVSPTLKARAKFVDNIRIQIEGAKAELNGETFTRKTKIWVDEPETGERVFKEVPLKFRAWYWRDEKENVMLGLKYGARKIELSPGKPTIEVGKEDKLIPTLEMILEAAEAGEMDEIVTHARTRARPGHKEKDALRK